MIAAILQIIAVVLSFFKPKATAPNPVTTANTMTAQSAQIGRETAQQTAKDMQDATNQNRPDLDRTSHPDSVRDGLDALSRLNDRANQTGSGQ